MFRLTIEKYCKSIGKVSDKITVKYQILFYKIIGIGIGNTFITKYWYRYWQYFKKVSLTTLVVSHFTKQHLTLIFFYY